MPIYTDLLELDEIKLQLHSNLKVGKRGERCDLQMLRGSDCKYIFLHQLTPVFNCIKGIVLVGENFKEFLFIALTSPNVSYALVFR